MGDSTGPTECCALIAVKRRSQCKSRLGAALTAVQRLGLVRAMLSQVIAAAVGASTVHRVFVVSPERDQIPAPVTVLRDAGIGLNAALTGAQRDLIARGYREFVILPADLPLVEPSDIDRLVQAGRRTGFAVVPDSAGIGTNALFIRTYQSFRFQFGHESSDAHRIEARMLGMDPLIVRVPGVEFDLDTPEDLRRLDLHRWDLPCLA